MSRREVKIYTKEELLQMPKKEVVKVAGYPNITQLCKANPDMRRKSCTQINVKGARGRRRDKWVISSKSPSKRQIISEIV